MEKLNRKGTYGEQIDNYLEDDYNRGAYVALLCAQKKGITEAIECHIPQFLKEPEEDGLVRNCKIFSIVEVR